MAVITISRLFGAGGRHFGLEVARGLGYDYFDKEILTLLSGRLGRDEERITAYETMDLGPARSVLEMLNRKYPFTGADFPGTSDYGGALAGILREIAARGRVVIVGRGGQAVLADHAEAVHLRLVADEQYLAAQLAGEEEFDSGGRDEILKQIHEHSEARRSFVRRHFAIDCSDPLNYHLVINLGRLPAGEAETLVISMVRGRDSERSP